MINEALEESALQKYWVAIRFSALGRVYVFEPYVEREAKANRAGWLKSFPSPARISGVFQAESKEAAEADAGFYLMN